MHAREHTHMHKYPHANVPEQLNAPSLSEYLPLGHSVSMVWKRHNKEGFELGKLDVVEKSNNGGAWYGTLFVLKWSKNIIKRKGKAKRAEAGGQTKFILQLLTSIVENNK